MFTKSIQQAEDATITVIRYGDGDSHQVLIYFENVDHSFNGKVFYMNGQVSRSGKKIMFTTELETGR